MILVSKYASMDTFDNCAWITIYLVSSKISTAISQIRKLLLIPWFSLRSKAQNIVTLAMSRGIHQMSKCIHDTQGT